MSDFRGALIGCGFFSINHLHGWRGVEGASIVAICDRDPARLASVGEQFGIARRYADARGDADERDSSISSISRPRRRRTARWSNSPRGHGVAVICQKPFASSLQDARAMVAACESAGVAADGA